MNKPPTRFLSKTQSIYLVIGCPGSGKSWVCDQLSHLYTYVHHDLYVKMTGFPYVRKIIAASKGSRKPVLAEAPFSISQIKEPLESYGLKVVPVFIQEKSEVISERYLKREGKPIPSGHLTRQKTYQAYARDWKAFSGTSGQVFEHLRTLGESMKSNSIQEGVSHAAG